MFLAVILFYVKQIIFLHKKNNIMMSLNNPNTFSNIIFNNNNNNNNVSNIGYDERYPKTTNIIDYELLKKQYYNMYIKKKMLDVLENKNININNKIEILKKYDFIQDNDMIKPINLNPDNIMKYFDYEI